MLTLSISNVVVLIVYCVIGTFAVTATRGLIGGVVMALMAKNNKMITWYTNFWMRIIDKM